MNAALLVTTALFTWTPNPGPQTDFLSCGAYEVLYGGAAGGGKSESLLADALRGIATPSYRALLLRRTYPELERSLIDRSRQLYRGVDPGAAYNSQEKCWRFSSGARIYFGHAEHEHSVHQYQGAEFSFIGFDELTHFTERQYLYLLSRARSSAGLPVYIRSATNPGGDGHEWVMRRWAPWLNPASGVKAAPGQTLYYVNAEDGPEWVERGTPHALSRTFIPAKVDDNPHLMQNDPGYRQRLMGLDVVTRAQLLHGDWLIRPAAGLLFKRAWFEFVDAAPSDAAVRVRFWDRAATEKKAGNDPDWTVGVRMSRTVEGTYCIEDVVRLRGTPSEVERTIRNTADLDGHRCEVHLSQDPGSAGKFESAYYTKALAGYTVKTEPETGDKVTRAKPASAQCEAGNVRILRGRWNDAFVQCLEEFPDGAHDDDVDALSGAFRALHSKVNATYIKAVRTMAAQGGR